MNVRTRLHATALLLVALPYAGSVQAAELTTHSYHDGVIRTCRIDLRHDTLRMFWKDDKGTPFADFTRLQARLRAQGEELVCATNGGIYQEDLRPLGLYIEEGRTLHPLNGRRGAYGNFYLEPNGVFFIAGREARIVETDRFRAELSEPGTSIRFATQSGPILLQKGRINTLFAPQSRNRNIRGAVCIVSAHQVILALAETPVSFHEFARFLREKLQCTDALHMDSKISRLFPHDGFVIAPPYSVIIGATRAGSSKSR